jgi:GLPGLI family protein
MRYLITALLIFTNIICLSQNTTKVTFENKATISADEIKNVPKAVQELVLKQLQATIVISTMNVKNSTVYYHTKSQIQEKISNGNGKSTIVNGKVNTLDRVNTSVESSENKFVKDAIKFTYTKMVDGKQVTENLPKTTWKITKKTKKIMGYNCFEAIGTYKNQPITVYFTKELKAKASPDLLPFIDGVILEYDTGRKQGIAIKVEKNQPDVKDFFKK